MLKRQKNPNPLPHQDSVENVRQAVQRPRKGVQRWNVNISV